jgi:murein DD-endopeptidase MepM/ murein hydrolase activator NlpD
MKIMPKKIFLILLVFSVSFFVAAYSEDPGDNPQKELLDIQQKILREKKILEETRAKERNKLRDLFFVRKRIDQTKQQLNISKYQLDKENKNLLGLKESLVHTQTKLERQRLLAGNRLRSVYKQKGMEYVTMFFLASTRSDFLDNLYFMKNLLKQDQNVVQAMGFEYQQLSVKKTAVERQKNVIETLVEKISYKKTQLSKEELEHQRLYQDLKQQRIEYEKRVAELEQQSLEIEKYIREKIMRSGQPLKKYGTGVFAVPAQGPKTSAFGYRIHPIFKTKKFHTGQDIGAPYGSKILASDAGEVVFAGWWGSETTGYGRIVIIAHGNDLTTLYAHQSRIAVKKGDVVEKGDVIGYVGSSGYSTGPHLHFEVRKSGTPVDPTNYVRF